MATCHPSPSPPSRASAGMRASVKNTSLSISSPVRSRIGRHSTPGVVRSTMKAVIPEYFVSRLASVSGSVRNRKRPKRARCAEEVQVFCPFTT